MVGVDQVAEAVGEGEALASESEGGSAASVRWDRVTPLWLGEGEALAEDALDVLGDLGEVAGDPSEPQALRDRVALRQSAAVSSRSAAGWRWRNEGHDDAVST